MSFGGLHKIISHRKSLWGLEKELKNLALIDDIKKIIPRSILPVKMEIKKNTAVIWCKDSFQAAQIRETEGVILRKTKIKNIRYLFI